MNLTNFQSVSNTINQRQTSFFTKFVRININLYAQIALGDQGIIGSREKFQSLFTRQSRRVIDNIIARLAK